VVPHLLAQERRFAVVVSLTKSRAPDFDRPTVLYVEDEALLRLAIADDMREAGFIVMEAGTAVEAMAIMQSSLRLDVLMTEPSRKKKGRSPSTRARRYPISS
jgi:CheY-like chemotaxis protein